MGERKFPIYSDGIGSLTIGDEEVILVKDNKKTRLKRSYIVNVEKEQDLPLNKVELRFEYYDLLGSKEGTRFAMHEADFRALKDLLGWSIIWVD